MGAAGRTMVLGGLAVLASGAIIGALAGGTGLWLHWLCKPLATLWLIVWVARMGIPAAGQRYRRWVLAGLCLSLLGDVLLMLPQGVFVPGLVAFLLAHLCYIVAFAPGAAGRRWWPALILVGLLALLNLVGLWPQLPAPMQLPVASYVLVIAVMAVLALVAGLGGRAAPGSRQAAAGALLFMASDSWLAWDRFAGPLPWAIAGVLLTYWAAQYLIAASCQTAGRDQAGSAGQ